jgi:tRNA(fMet)-specific endonuclease VapC
LTQIFAFVCCAIGRKACEQGSTRRRIRFVSTIVLTELLYGAEKSAAPTANLRQIERFASGLQVLVFDEAAAAHAANIRAILDRRGIPIGGYDLLIAGHARSRRLAVNLKEFRRVEGLLAEDWLADG